MRADGVSLSRNRRAFTLIEIMLVVSVIGLLSAISVPAYMRSRSKAKATKLVNDLRVFEDAFKMYNLEYGGYPPNGSAYGVLPPGMEQYIKSNLFMNPTPCGGRYMWRREGVGPYALGSTITVINDPATNGAKTDLVLLAEVDKMMDDGVPATGRFRIYSGMHYLYYIEFK